MRREHWAVRPVLIGAMIGGGLGAIAMLAANHTTPATAASFDQPAQTKPQAIANVRPFRNCAEARAAGAAPVYMSDPRYTPWLDGDDDGIGCEPYRR